MLPSLCARTRPPAGASNARWPSEAAGVNVATESAGAHAENVTSPSLALTSTGTLAPATVAETVTAPARSLGARTVPVARNLRAASLSGRGASAASYVAASNCAHELALTAYAPGALSLTCVRPACAEERTAAALLLAASEGSNVSSAACESSTGTT
eukprot:m51a1_g13441 hypothetical protein (157) ;mRNA; f:1542-2264